MDLHELCTLAVPQILPQSESTIFQPKCLEDLKNKYEIVFEIVLYTRYMFVI